VGAEGGGITNCEALIFKREGGGWGTAKTPSSPSFWNADAKRRLRLRARMDGMDKMKRVDCRARKLAIL
jgi:hypothetical protein